MNYKFRLTVLLVLVLVLGARSGVAIEIDGKMADWTTASTYEVTEALRDQALTPFARTRRLAVAHDDEFLYFRVDFEKARPFTDGTQAKFKEKYWANRRYIELDVDGDSKVDYVTTMHPGKKKGLNNCYLVRHKDGERNTYLWYEGTKAWNGMRGHYSADGKSVEIRIPRAPLKISTNLIGVRVQMQIRDGLEGDNAWHNMRYPSDTAFYLYDLKKGARIEAAPALAGRSITMGRARVAPVLDGALDDVAWKTAARLDGFIKNRGAQAATMKTEAFVTFDATNLYIGVRAYDDELDRLVTKATVAEPSRVYGDDVIEIFIDHHHDQASCLHVGVNAIGTVAAQLVIARSGQRRMMNIPSFLRTAVGAEQGAWIVELAIPFAGFSAVPQPGETWGLNVNRGAPRSREYSSWAGVQGGFLQPEKFGLMRFPSESSLVVTSRGLVARAGNADQANALCGMFASTATGKLTARAMTRSGGAVVSGAECSLPLIAGKPCSFRLPYRVRGDHGETVTFTVDVEGRQLYRSVVPVIQTDFPKTWLTADPLYHELFGSKGAGLAAEGVIMWGHDIVSYRFGAFCLKYAQPYVLGAVYRNAAEHKLHYISNSLRYITEDLFQFKTHAKKLPLSMIYMGSSRSKTEGKPAEKNGVSYMGDPDNQAVYLRTIRKTLSEHKEWIWGFMVADELQEHDLTRGLRFHYGEQGPYPMMARVDAEVKREFGFGKFGIPTSLKDANPYRWMAYRRWYNHQFSAFQKRIYETVKEVAPKVHVISVDPVARVMPLDYSGYGQHVDIMTHQLYPRNSRWIQSSAWITKTLRDLSGKPVMPCAHVENYSNTFRPDEVRELMSQVYRGGGEGFHLYMPDTAGKQGGVHDMRSDRYGSWPRWETVMGTLANAAGNPRPVYPDPDCAVFFSNDGEMGELAGGLRGKDRFCWLFQLLGPVSRGWFQVISDNQVGRSEIDLSSYPVIYVPGAAHFQRREVVQAIWDYVNRGGTLVVCQPDAFAMHLDGTPNAKLLAALLPARGDLVEHTRLTVTNASPTGSFALPLAPPEGKGAEIVPADGVVPILLYEDKAIAAARKQVGKGQVVYFAFEPLFRKTVENANWRAFWTAFHKGLGLKIGQDIWRFTFPKVPAASQVLESPTGWCLSNNYVMWDTNEPVPVKNIEVAGTYSYSRPPDYGTDEGGVTDIPFSRGDLFDRRTAMKIKDGD
ncbi:MAG: hypothetical protein KAI66_19740, partial [Lentisphaeria bacterium]|nr:hypothetical protein [Lentisphaeria bacterium]